MQQGKKRILVVNDEEDMLEQINRWLAIAGYLVQSAITAEQGLKLFREDQYDLIVLDYHLKAEKTGAKTAKTFIPLFKNINPLVPIVIISATETKLDQNKLGVSAVFIVKGSLWKNLSSIIEQAFNN